MTDKKQELRCGCGGKIRIFQRPSNNEWTGRCLNEKCVLGMPLISYLTEAEAIAAFRLATRADIKQGINWISVKDRLPENVRDVLIRAKGNKATCGVGFYGDDEWERNDNGINTDITHWAEINLPEAKNERD